MSLFAYHIWMIPIGWFDVLGVVPEFYRVFSAGTYVLRRLRWVGVCGFCRRLVWHVFACIFSGEVYLGESQCFYLVIGSCSCFVLNMSDRFCTYGWYV